MCVLKLIRRRLLFDCKNCDLSLLRGDNFADYSCVSELSSELWNINLSALRNIKDDVSILLRQFSFIIYLNIHLELELRIYVETNLIRLPFDY